MITAIVFGVGLLLGAVWMSDLRRLPAARGAQADDRRRRAVSVVIPARNEATNLPHLLSSLEACGDAVAEIVVVDDDSVDATAAEAVLHGARVIQVEGGPPAGWTGKAHACARGAATATSPMLLFLDADVTLAPDAIDRLLVAHSERGGLISVQPHHITVRGYEQLSAVCNVVAMMGTGAFAPLRRRARPAAFGPCLMTSASDYDLAGGHAAVRSEVVDDVHLARRFAAVGLPVTVYAGAQQITFRMYPGGARQLIEGWSKNLAAGAGLVDPLAVLVSVWWVTATLGFGVLAITTLAGIGPASSSTVAIAAAGWIATAAVMTWLLRRIGRFRWWASALHVVPAAAFVAIFARSLWLTLVRRRVSWRGRRLEVGKDHQ